MPKVDYMVDISGKTAQIKKMVDDRCYFTINRAKFNESVLLDTSPDIIVLS